MKLFLSTIVLLVSFSAPAQKEDLNKLNVKLLSVLNNSEGIHLDYLLTVVGNGKEPEIDSMKMSFYKQSKDVFKMEMGNAQTLLRNKNNMLKVDHVNKLIVYEIDTASTEDGSSMLTQLIALTDSATTIKFVKENGFLVYNLSFNKGAIFKHIQLKFSSKTELLNSLYAEYYPAKEQLYNSLFVNYKLWDLDWKDKKNELNINQYIEKVKEGYQPVASFKNYKLLNPQKAR